MEAILQAEHISKSFKGTEVLSDISLSIHKGEILAIIGESGSGKSTLLRILAGFLPPDSGRIMLNGSDFLALKGLESRKARRSIQLVFQSPYQSLDPRMTVEKIIKEATREDISPYMDEVQLGKNLLGKRPSELSGGERQRVAIARALAAKPDILLADEPISSLDASLKAGLLNLLLDIRERSGMAIMIVEHDMKAAMSISDSIITLERGRISHCKSSPSQGISIS